MLWTEAFHSDKDFELELDGSGLVEDGSITPGSITPGSFVPPSDDYFDVSSPAGQLLRKTGITATQETTSNHYNLGADGEAISPAAEGVSQVDVAVAGDSADAVDSIFQLITYSGSSQANIADAANKSVVSRLTLPGGDRYSLLFPLGESHRGEGEDPASPYQLVSGEYTGGLSGMRHPGLDGLNAFIQSHVPSYNPLGQPTAGVPPSPARQEAFDWTDNSEAGLVYRRTGLTMGQNPTLTYSALHTLPFSGAQALTNTTIGATQIRIFVDPGYAVGFRLFDGSASLVPIPDANTRSIILRVTFSDGTHGSFIFRCSQADPPGYTFPPGLIPSTDALIALLPDYDANTAATADFAVVENSAGWIQSGNNVVRDIQAVAAVGDREEFDWSDEANQVGVYDSQRGALVARRSNRAISYNPSDPDALLIAQDSNSRVVLGGALRSGLAASSTSYSFIVRFSVYTSGQDNYTNDYAEIFPLDAATLSAPNTQGEVTFRYDAGGAMRAWINGLSDAQWGGLRVSWAIVEDSAGWVNDGANIARWVVLGSNDWSGISPATLDLAIVENSAGWVQDANGTVRLPASLTPPVIVEPVITPTPEYYWNETNPEGELARVTGVAMTQSSGITDQTNLWGVVGSIPGFSGAAKVFQVGGTYESPGGGAAPFSSGRVGLGGGRQTAHPEDKAFVVRLTLAGGEQFSGIFYLENSRHNRNYSLSISNSILTNDSQRTLAEMIKFLPPYQATTTATLDLAVVRADAGWTRVGNQVVRLKDNIPNAPYIALERSPANFPPNFLDSRLWLTEHGNFDDDGNYTPAPEIRFPGKVIWEGVGWMQNRSSTSRNDITDDSVSGGLPDAIPIGAFGSLAPSMETYSGRTNNGFQRLRTFAAYDSRGGTLIYNMADPFPVQTRFAIYSTYSVWTRPTSFTARSEVRANIWRSFVVLTRDADLHDPYNFFQQTGPGRGAVRDLEELMWYIANGGPGYTTSATRGFPSRFSGTGSTSLIIRNDIQLVQMWDLYQLIDTGKLKNGSMYEKISVQTEGTGHYYRLSLNNRARSNSSINNGVIKYKFGR